LDAGNARLVAEIPLKGTINAPCASKFYRLSRKDRSFMKRYSGFLLLAAGAVLMGAGLLRGEAAIVLQKAVVLCLECIGLG
jgi:hypothetical protein